MSLDLTIALSSAITDIATKMGNLILALLPIALTVVGSIFLTLKGIRFFHHVARGGW